MIITSISYQFVKNLGDDEGERLGATATVEEGEDPYQAAIALRRFVHLQLLTDHPGFLFEKQTIEKDHNPLFDEDDEEELTPNNNEGM